MDTELTTRLRGLMAKATQGPWGVFCVGKTISIDPRGGDGRNPTVVAWAGFDGSDMPFKTQKANAALIAESINALPTILDALESQGREIERLTYEYGKALAHLAKLLKDETP